MFKPGLSLSDFKIDVDFIFFLQRQRVEKKIVKVNQKYHLVKWFPNEMSGNNKQP